MSVELFLTACNAYEAWWSCGRDFRDHANKFLVWDDAINAYAASAGVSRDTAINLVRSSLGMSDAR
jgi:hypothetical protein